MAHDDVNAMLADPDPRLPRLVQLQPGQPVPGVPGTVLAADGDLDGPAVATATELIGGYGITRPDDTANPVFSGPGSSLYLVGDHLVLPLLDSTFLTSTGDIGAPNGLPGVVALAARTEVVGLELVERRRTALCSIRLGDAAGEVAWLDIWVQMIRQGQDKARKLKPKHQVQALEILRAWRMAA